MKITKESFKPNPENFQAIKAAGEKIRPDDDAIAKWCDGFIQGNALRISFDLDLVKRFAPENGTVVDVGAIPPLLLTALKQDGFGISGLDLAPERFATVIEQLGLDIRACNIEVDRIPHDDNSIDLMVLNEVFEHMRINLIATFKELWRVMKPGGCILMSTPNALAMHLLVRIVRHRRLGPSMHFEYSKIERVGHMGHVREYTVNEVLEFAQQMGFEVPEIIYRGRYHNRWIDMPLRAFPALRPFVSYVLRKPLVN